jgi:hypothetical protein
MDFTIKTYPKENLAYIPKQILKILGENPTATTNRTAVLVYPANLGLEDVIKSLKIIKADLEHAKEMQEKESAKP